MPKEELEKKLEDEFSRGMTGTPVKKLGHRLVSVIGSWSFLVVNILWFVIWIISGLHYDLLTFWVSLEAIVLSVLILINENRELESDRKRAIKDYKIDLTTARRLKEIQREVSEIKELLESQEPGDT